MTSDSSAVPFVAIVGPTASGKSQLAIEMAEVFGGEIVNCDSMQVYRGFDIGTAKLPVESRQRIPHHLIDICDPGETFNAGDYAKLARSVITDMTGRGRLPIVAGGTGFYLGALLRGLFAGPGRNQDLRQRLTERAQPRPHSLHRLLSRFDPAAAERIHPNDHSKLIRALEIYLMERRPATELFAAGRDSFAGHRCLPLMLDPAREEVYRRINQRCIEMFQNGLLEEVRDLLAAGVPRTAQPMRAVGYSQAIAVLDGSISLDDAIADAQQATRNYAKRQWTWFRKEPGVVALQGFGDENEVLSHAAELTRNFVSQTLA